MRTHSHQPLRRGAFLCAALLSAMLLLSGCTVVAVTASAASLAASAAIGTVKIVGKGVGMAADAVMGDDEKDDGSGITIKYRESASAPATSSPPTSAPLAPTSPAQNSAQ